MWTRGKQRHSAFPPLSHTVGTPATRTETAAPWERLGPEQHYSVYNYSSITAHSVDRQLSMLILHTRE